VHGFSQFTPLANNNTYDLGHDVDLCQHPVRAVEIPTEAEALSYVLKDPLLYRCLVRAGRTMFLAQRVKLNVVALDTAIRHPHGLLDLVCCGCRGLL